MCYRTGAAPYIYIYIAIHVSTEKRHSVFDTRSTEMRLGLFPSHCAWRHCLWPYWYQPMPFACGGEVPSTLCSCTRAFSKKIRRPGRRGGVLNPLPYVSLLSNLRNWSQMHDVVQFVALRSFLDPEQQNQEPSPVSPVEVRQCSLNVRIPDHHEDIRSPHS